MKVLRGLLLVLVLPLSSVQAAGAMAIAKPTNAVEQTKVQRQLDGEMIAQYQIINSINVGNVERAQAFNKIIRDYLTAKGYTLPPDKGNR